MMHRYAEALRWIADGKDAQIRWGSKLDWLYMSESSEIVNDEVLRGVAGYEFRLKPHTVKIGSREVGAPVMEPAEGQTLWFTNSFGVVQRSMFEGESGVKAKRASGGRYFASEAAAIAAHEAISALLRGEA